MRLVPLSLEMRRTLYRYKSKYSGPGKLVFAARYGGKLALRYFQESPKVSPGRETGHHPCPCSPHTLRHTFAVTYLRKGGNLEFLRRILGHSSILTTQRYLQSLGVQDIRHVHDQLSPLGRRKGRE